MRRLLALAGLLLLVAVPVVGRGHAAVHAGRDRDRGDVPGLRHAPRPVALARREPDPRLHRREARGGVDEAAGQGRARRAVRRADPGDHADRGLGPVRLAGAAGGRVSPASASRSPSCWSGGAVRGPSPSRRPQSSTTSRGDAWTTRSATSTDVSSAGATRPDRRSRERGEGGGAVPPSPCQPRGGRTRPARGAEPAGAVAGGARAAAARRAAGRPGGDVRRRLRAGDPARRRRPRRAAAGPPPAGAGAPDRRRRARHDRRLGRGCAVPRRARPAVRPARVGAGRSRRLRGGGRGRRRRRGPGAPVRGVVGAARRPGRVGCAAAARRGLRAAVARGDRLGRHAAARAGLRGPVARPGDRRAPDRRARRLRS